MAQQAWRWTKQRECCLELHIAGVSQRQIAKMVGVHRNTVNAWCKQPEFRRAVNERMADLVGALRLRRLHETNEYGSRLARLTSSALDRAEESGDVQALRAAMDLLAEYRAMRDQERQDLLMDHLVDHIAPPGSGASEPPENTEFRRFLASQIDAV